jgi:hypothetical protein
VKLLELREGQFVEVFHSGGRRACDDERES